MTFAAIATPTCVMSGLATPTLLAGMATVAIFILARARNVKARAAPSTPDDRKTPAAAQPCWGDNYKVNVLFLCTHNSCRSQMADAWMRQLRGSELVGVASAGIADGQKIKDGAIKVMAEVGIDLQSCASNALSEFSPECFDVVVTCCSCGKNLDGALSKWKQRKLFLDWSLDGPEKLDPGDFSVFRRVRDETRSKCQELLSFMQEEEMLS